MVQKISAKFDRQVLLQHRHLIAVYVKQHCTVGEIVLANLLCLKDMKTIIYYSYVIAHFESFDRNDTTVSVKIVNDRMAIISSFKIFSPLQFLLRRVVHHLPNLTTFVFQKTSFISNSFLAGTKTTCAVLPFLISEKLNLVFLLTRLFPFEIFNSEPFD